jgi:hypothetical protein
MGRISILFILLMAIQVGCSIEKSKAAKVLGPSELPVGSLKEGQDLLKEPVVCEGVCAEAVGAFYFYHSKKRVGEQDVQQIKLCSATLIAANKIMTNKHCIQDLLTQGEDCSESKNIEIKFPAISEKPFQVAKCKKILKTSSDVVAEGPAGEASIQRLAPDWAVIELQADVKDRRPVSKSRIETRQEQPVSLFPVYFEKSTDGGAPLGKIKLVSCVQDFSNQTNIYSWKQGVSPLLSLKDCDHELISGNSGSGIFEPQSGKMLGVLATTSDATSADGTQVHCFPDFMTMRESSMCRFDKEGVFEQIHKVASFLKKILQVELEELNRNEWELAADSWIFSGELYRQGDLKSLRIQWKTPWKEHLEKASALNDAHLYREIEEDFIKILIASVPLCFQSEKSLDTVSLPFFHFSQMNFNDYVIWSEVDGRAQLQFKNSEKIEVLLYQIPLKLQKKGKDFLVTTPQVPDKFPFATMEFRVPSCSRDS